MAIEHTPRLGLTQWTDPNLLDPVHPDQFNADAAALDDLAAIAVQGTAAERPAFGVRGRLYYATDTGDLTYDTGTEWVAVDASDAAVAGFVNDPASQTRVALNATVAESTAFVRAGRGTSWVAWGDSLTAGADNPNTPARGVSWPTYVGLHTDERVHLIRNSGVGGDTTAEMLARFDADVAAMNPDVVTICGGRNDISGAVPLATTQANLTAMVEAVRSIGALPVLLSTFPTNATGDQAETLALNTWIESYAGDNDIPFVDVFAALVDGATGGYRTGLAQPDGVHPNAAGTRTAGEFIGTALLDIVPWYSAPFPRVAEDESNRLPNRFWTTPTFNGDFSPSGWTALNGAQSTARRFFTDESGVTWVEYTFAESTAEFQIRLLSGSRPVADPGGETWGASGLIHTNLTAGQGLTIQISARNATPIASYALYQIPGFARGRIYLEVFANSYLNYQLVVPAGSTGIVRLAEPTLFRIN